MVNANTPELTVVPGGVIEIPSREHSLIIFDTLLRASKILDGVLNNDVKTDEIEAKAIEDGNSLGTKPGLREMLRCCNDRALLIENQSKAISDAIGQL